MKNGLTIGSFLFVFTLCLLAAGILSRPVDSKVILVAATPAANGVITGYKHWTRVNAVPQKMNWITSFSCAPAATADPDDPHHNKFATVYVNQAGRASMLSKKFPVFPEGSVLVKEKLATKHGTSLELLTVMRKREAGYDPTKGNWEYMVFSGDGQTLLESGKLEKCQACHLNHQATDYVTRLYLSPNQMKRLK